LSGDISQLQNSSARVSALSDELSAVKGQLNATVGHQGSILQNAISDENFKDKFSVKNFGQICAQKHE
jgi:hypothetical protein